jgi:ribonucleotide monophosphatase NagD (HAD superfamily)
LGADVPDTSILAIGDGVITDIKGAIGEDIDSLFISGGLAAAETKTVTQPDPDLLTAYLETEMSSPTFTIGHLR